jgi:MFS family permease
MLTIPNYIFCCLAASIGGFLNGFDTGSIGAIVAMQQFEVSVGKLTPTLLGFTVSLIMLTGALPAPFAGQLAEKFGRLGIIMLGVALFIIGAVLQGAAQELNMFLVGRALGGFGEGIYLSNVSVYICEIAPVKLRGTLAGLPQFMATAGVCFGYFLCYGTVHMESSLAWRVPYILQSILGLAMIGSCFKCPDSPRWLVQHGRRTEALDALRRLDFSMAEAEKDILSAQNEQQINLSAWQGFLLLFKRGYRARTILALFVLGMVQLSGIDGVLYVSVFPPFVDNTY